MSDGRTIVLFVIVREESALFEVRCTTVWFKLKKLINSEKQREVLGTLACRFISNQ